MRALIARRVIHAHIFGNSSTKWFSCPERHHIVLIPHLFSLAFAAIPAIMQTPCALLWHHYCSTRSYIKLDIRCRRHNMCAVQSTTTCLLYTSDAADDLLCVDLGGRRIIKKKKN